LDWVLVGVELAKLATALLCEGNSIRLMMIARLLKPRLPDLRARRIMLTHMNPVMLVHLDEVRAAGALVAEDGAVIDL
jgi:hypothetical protein